MKVFNWLFLFFFFSSLSVFSQEKYTRHSVSKGETISEIAKQYNVKSSEIYELNPNARKGIKFKTVLLIPTKAKKNKVSTTAIAANPEKAYEVLPKETLYGIAKQHNITVEDLYKINPDLEKEGLKIGQKIKIPQTALEDLVLATKPEKEIEVKKVNAPKKNNFKNEVVISPKEEEKIEIPTEGIVREVLRKETFYSIAKLYKISVADLQKANPELGTKALKAGQKIIVPVKEDIDSNLALEVKPKKKEKDPSDNKQAKKIVDLPRTIEENRKSESGITREVLPKESFYSIAKLYKITVAELKKANPELETKSLKVGQKIIVPVTAENDSNLALEVKPKKTEKNRSNSNETKQIVVVPQDIEGNKPETEITHEVLPKETKYGIAKEYGLTVAELEKQNPEIERRLRVGHLLKIRSSKVIEKSAPIETVVFKEESLDKKNFNSNIPIVRDSAFVDQLISTASENIGTRYRSGGTTKDGFDCSGLMCATFGTFDIKLPRSSIEMSSYGSKIDTENAQKGDLIFFKTNGRRQINHVGMVVEVLDGEIKFIHSSNHGGVIISSTKESYYEKNLVQVNRVL